MQMRHALASGLLGILGILCLVGFDFASPQALQQQNEILFRQLQDVHGLSNDQIDADSEDICQVGLHWPRKSGDNSASGNARGVSCKTEQHGSAIRESEI